MLTHGFRIVTLAAGLAIAAAGFSASAAAQNNYLTGGLLGGALGAAVGGAVGGGKGAGIGAAAGIGAGLLGSHLATEGERKDEARREAYQQGYQQGQQQGTQQGQQQGQQQYQAYQQQQPPAAPQTFQQPGPNAQLVRDVQSELSALGYDVGAIDGQVGARTINAVQSYQYNNNLLVDGQVTQQLLDHVRTKRAQLSGQQYQAPADSKQPSYSAAAAQPGTDPNCREVTQTLNIDGQDVVKRVKACRNPDGTWTVQ